MAAMFITRNSLFRFSKSLPHASSVSHRPSRVTFASTPNSSNVTEERRDWTAEADEMSERGKETMRKGFDRSKEYAEEAKEQTKDAAESMKDSAKDAAGTVADKSREGVERTKEKTEEMVGSLKNVGEKAKQGMQGAWEKAKDTTHKIKDTVVGKDDDDRHGGPKDKDEDVADLKRRVEDGTPCFRGCGRRNGERRGKSIRGSIVSPDLSVLNLVIVKKGENDLPGLTDLEKPRLRGPKRASKIRKLFDLSKEDDGKRSKAPKIQRLVTPLTLQRNRARIADEKKRIAKAKSEAA
ncbi:hypothetical protein VNO78_03815 [Psophocarpus tetragonolobus]|uniref:40S ribosomal protein S6 n=1 Tax=Psophocarpus tetragonolobus TaxID=3891 RepID=A0AAN9T2V6_PSOTE